jgi:sugar phosphate isomerase/epimerase
MMNLNRRELLKVLGAGVASAAAAAMGATAVGAQEKNDRKRAGRKGKKGNLKLGIFASVYEGLPLDEAVRKIKEDGFAGAVLNYGFKDVQFDPMKPDWDALKRMTAAFEKQDLQVAGLYGYYNVIDPDPARRKYGEDRIELLIKNWKRFGSPIISTETGSYNPKSEFLEDPKNFTEEGYKDCRAAFERLVREAEKNKAIIAIEPYWRNIIGTVERTERLFKDIPSESLMLTMDPCNYFRNQDLPKMRPMLNEMFTRFGGRTVIAHAKDVKANGDAQELPAAGLGVLDYPTYLRDLIGLGKDLFLVIEHLKIDDVKRARDYVRGQMAKV